MLGAGILASLAAFRVGAGLVYLMTVDEPFIAVQYPEIMTVSLAERGCVIQEDLFGVFPKNRSESAKDVGEHCQQFFVLKGFETVVTDGNQVYVNSTGNPGMATACSAVYFHGASGDMVFKTLGNGLMATDIIQGLPQVMRA